MEVGPLKATTKSSKSLSVFGFWLAPGGSQFGFQKFRVLVFLENGMFFVKSEKNEISKSFLTVVGDILQNS